MTAPPLVRSVTSRTFQANATAVRGSSAAGAPDRDSYSGLTDLCERYPTISIVVLSGQREAMLGALQLMFGGSLNFQAEILARDNASAAQPRQSSITNDGLLQIDWPIRADTGERLASIDLLLATATKPTPDTETHDYPDARDIAARWIDTKDDSYFRGNRSHGFHTFQDDEIERHLARSMRH